MKINNLPKGFRLTTVFVIIFFLLTTNFSIAASELGEQEVVAKIESLKKTLQQNPTHLQYAEYMMLKAKYLQKELSFDKNKYSNEDYYLKPRGPSVLSQEFSGGINSPNNTRLYDGIEILTGEKAVDESLQLGSIGFDGITTQATINDRMLQSALELYFNDKGKYPATLNELVPNYIGIVPSGFSYSSSGSVYELKSLIKEPQQIDISQVQTLEIKSHPWESMLKKQPIIPDIFSLVPKDFFTVYFRDMDKFTELEQTIASIGKPLESIYSLNDSIEVKNKIFKRLGIKDINAIRSLVDEVALATYDLDSYPNTDYALIIKVKLSFLNSFISDYVTAPSDRRGQVGEYYVIATDRAIFEQITATKRIKSQSLASSQDLAYAMSVLEADYDGFVYFSEDFVKKLTAPIYRINARRRNTTLKALESMQYTVFAYRNITGSWPNSFQQIINEGYIKEGRIKDLQNYSIDSQGIVHHNIWGSIYDTTPIGRVPISTIAVEEKNLYNNFKEGYQNYWREFIDPIGITILVGDQIRFHTIILPLIDKSEYNWIKDIAGKESIVFDFIKNPDRLPSLQFLMKINVDDAIYAYYKSLGSYADPDYNNCINNYYSQRNNVNSSQKTPEEICKIKEKNREEAIKSIKDKVAKAIGWQEPTQVFDFIGNEVVLAAGENLIFNINDLSKLDVYFGAELKDTELSKKFIDQVFTSFVKNRSSDENDFGFFGLEAKPIKNSYNGVDYFIVPLGGMTNVYYTFLNGRVYLTVSQSALNNIIDGKTVGRGKKQKQTKLKWPNATQRLFDYLGNEMNVAMFADYTKLQNWLKSYIKNQWVASEGVRNINLANAYFTEALALAKSLPNYEGNISNVSQYYRFAPRKWFDASFLTHDSKAFLAVGSQEYELSSIDLLRFDYNNTDQTTGQKRVKLSDITNNFNVEKTLDDWNKLKNLGIAFSLTNEGLDVKIAFTNTVSNKIDSRINSTMVNKNKMLNVYLVAGGMLILVVVAWFVSRRKNTRIIPDSLSTNSEIFNPPIPKPHTKEPVSSEKQINF